MRLGAVEQAILVVCLQHRPENKRNQYEADLYRDELPGYVWGWARVSAFLPLGLDARSSNLSTVIQQKTPGF